MRRKHVARRDHEARILRSLWPRLADATLLELENPSRGFRPSEDWFSERQSMPHVKRREGYGPIRHKILSFLTPEERLEGLAPEERLAGVAPEEQILALSDEVLRGLPDEYIRTLPERVQQTIRKRLGR